MSILNYEEMTLESDTFQAARETFNLMLQKLFKKMEQYFKKNKMEYLIK